MRIASLEARGISSIVATGLLALAAGTGSAQAGGRVSVVFVDRLGPDVSARGAVGLYVPADGTRVTRQGALAAILRGKLYDSVSGSPPRGEVLFRPSRRPGPVTIYVALPPPGSHPNDRRYPLAIVGAGYHGRLVSGSTRIPGLVSEADIGPTVVALEHGTRPPIRAEADLDAVSDLQALDRRIDRAHRTRLAVAALLAALVILGSLLALATRSPAVARAALLVAPFLLVTGLVLSALGVSRPWPTGLLLAAVPIAVSAAIGARERLLLPTALAVLVTYLVVLAAWPDVNGLAAVGPHVEDGGRFYGLTNLVETILLTLTMVAAMLVPRAALAPLAAFAVVTFGWSRAGADGGGILVLAAAFAVFWLRAYGRLTRRSASLALVGAAALTLAVVGIDAASGGKSHVTRAFERGPGGWAGDFGHRVHLSADRFVGTWHSALVVCVGIAALAALATHRPRFPGGEALLAGLAVSLLVNDSPSDVLAGGAVCYGVLWTWELVRGAPLREVRVDSLPDAPPGPAPHRLYAAARRLRRRQDGLAHAEHGRGQRP
jgi:hypothetical protein